MTAFWKNMTGEFPDVLPGRIKKPEPEQVLVFLFRGIH